MVDLQDLYQELILDHNAHPHNFGALPGASHTAKGVNPLCGDEVSVSLLVNAHGIVEHIYFTGQGCAISKASASLMTTHIKGKHIQDVNVLFEAFHTLLTHNNPMAPAQLATLGKLAAFSGVRGFPMRVKCATLVWHTLRAALDGCAIPVSTEA